MPKQIIIEHPYKAVFKDDCYFVYLYDDIDYVNYVVYSKIVYKINNDATSTRCLYESESKIGKFFTQCQNELNNQ